MSEHCPCCGSPVRVHTSSEGTSSYEPVVPADALDRARDALLRALKGLSYMHHATNVDLKYVRDHIDFALAALAPKAEPEAHSKTLIASSPERCVHDGRYGVVKHLVVGGTCYTCEGEEAARWARNEERGIF
jgi:hypothetical protein